MPATTEETLAFVMKVLKHTELSKPDWKAIAAEEGISRADNAQQKFRRMIKDIGMEYVNDQITDPSGGGGGNGTRDNVATPTQRKRKSPTKKEKAAATGESPSKKSKVAEFVSVEIAKGGSPSKKTKVRQPEAAEAETDVKEEAQTGEA